MVAGARDGGATLARMLLIYSGICLAGYLFFGSQLRPHYAMPLFPVPALVARLSATMPLLPGDVIFTGTPAGVGLGRTPPRWLADGDVLTSHIEGIGEMRHRFVAALHPDDLAAMMTGAHAGR